MVEKHRVNSFAHRVIAPERERHIRNTTTNQRMGQVLFNPTAGLNKVQTITVVLLNTSSHRKHIGVKDNIFRRKANLINQNIVAALRDFLASLQIIRLAIFIKGHHHNGGTVLFAQLGFFNKLLSAFFKANGVNHRLALDAFKPSFDHLPFGGIHHNGHTGNLRLRGYQI